MTIVMQDFWRAPEEPFKGSFRRFSPPGSGQDTLFCSSSISKAQFPSAVMRQDAVLWGHLLRIGHRLLQRILARTVRHWKPWLMRVCARPRADAGTVAQQKRCVVKAVICFSCVTTILTFRVESVLVHCQNLIQSRGTYLNTFFVLLFS